MAKIVKIAANITYSGIRFNTPLICEYQHTGKIYELIVKGNVKKHTSSETIAQSWKEEGKKVREQHGYYFVKRMAIPNTNAKGEPDIWYINNDGDSCSVHKISKYGKKLHAQLSAMQPAN